MEYRNNNSERHELRKNLGNFGLPTLLTTKKGIENTIQYRRPELQPGNGYLVKLVWQKMMQGNGDSWNRIRMRTRR